jgi:hypothetical protein
MDMEVGVFAEVCECDITTLRMLDTNGFVKIEDSSVLILRNSGKEACDVLVISFEFSLSVWEDKDSGLDSWIPCCCPFAMRGDLLCRSGGARGDLHVANALRLFSVSSDAEQTGEDMVEVHRMARDEVCPFGDGELWARGRVDNGGECKLDISCIVLEERQ